MRIPKKLPAWMETLFTYLSEKGGSARTYGPIMTLIEDNWDEFVNERSDPPAPRAKRAPKKSAAPPPPPQDDDDGDGDDAADGQQEASAAAPTVVKEEPAIDPEEQARVDSMVRDQLRSLPEPLRRSVRDAYGPPRTPTVPAAPVAPLGPGWRHAEKQADDLYGTFRHQAATVGLPEDHPITLSVSGLYSLTKEAIAARCGPP